MIAYTLMLGTIFGISVIVNNGTKMDRKKKNRLILKLGILLIWGMCALKKETVGIDIAGYKRIYEQSAYWPWFSFSNVYFEEGYTLLMQLFSKNGISFQVFNAFVYALIYFPWYLFLKRYSQMPTLSLLIYICYQFWVFNMSGLRQGIAMSMCLLSFVLLEKKSLLRTLLFIFIVLIASTIHRSAVVFLIALGTYLAKVNIKMLSIFALCFVMSMVFREHIVSFVNSFAGIYQVSEHMELGGSFIMICGFAIYIIYTNWGCKYTGECVNTIARVNTEASTYMMLCSIALNLVLNGSNLLRGASYASMFLTISLPATIIKYKWKSRLILCSAIGIFLLALFYNDVLLANQLNIIPYKFFWQ